jgi:hypothetical protein
MLQRCLSALPALLHAQERPVSPVSPVSTATRLATPSNAQQRLASPLMACSPLAVALALALASATDTERA